MLRVAIVGCGKIADAHASQIRRIPGCEIVGACDQEELMAQQFAGRFQIRKSFHRIEALLDRTRPDVVHVTTPPVAILVSRCCVWKWAATCTSRSHLRWSPTMPRN